MYSRFDALDIMVVAVAQEDKDLESHGKMTAQFPDRPFEIVADMDRAGTERYERTSTYLIDREGIVRQVFPQVIHYRADWETIITECERLFGE